MASSQSNFVWKLTAILAVALVLRLAAGWWWQQRLPAGVKFGFGDSESYWELGRTIARGEPYEYGLLDHGLEGVESATQAWLVTRKRRRGWIGNVDAAELVAVCAVFRRYWAGRLAATATTGIDRGRDARRFMSNDNAVVDSELS